MMDRLTYLYIYTYLHICIQEPRPFIVMEHLVGGSLHQDLNQQATGGAPPPDPKSRSKSIN